MATDADSGLNQQLSYRIESGAQDKFLISANSGVIRVANITIDREERDTYRLTVVAVDRGMPPLSGTATVNILVDDVNDYRPEFINPIQTVSVVESAVPGTIIAEVTAIDRDLNPRLEYYIIKILAKDDTNALVLGQQGAFAVDFKTGTRTRETVCMAGPLSSPFYFFPSLSALCLSPSPPFVMLSLSLSFFSPFLLLPLFFVCFFLSVKSSSLSLSALSAAL